MSGVNIIAGLDSLLDSADRRKRSQNFASKLYNAGVLDEDDDASLTYFTKADASKGTKSRIWTEYVPVPSFKHAVEIAGRDGCNIKELYVETGTYIKTPIPGEEPVFIVSSKSRENVELAKRRLQFAA